MWYSISTSEDFPFSEVIYLKKHVKLNFTSIRYQRKIGVRIAVHTLVFISPCPSRCITSSYFRRYVNITRLKVSLNHIFFPLIVERWYSKACIHILPWCRNFSLLRSAHVINLRLHVVGSWDNPVLCDSIYASKVCRIVPQRINHRIRNTSFSIQTSLVVLNFSHNLDIL